MRLIFIALFFIPVVAYTQSITATYSNGDISTNHGSYSPSCNGPLTTLTLTLPPGGLVQVTGIDISYNMTAQGGGFKSHQRSHIFFQNSSLSESTVYEGAGETGGIMSYTRTNVSIANGSYAGGTNLIFEMRAWRTVQGVGCNTTFNKVDNFTWIITVHYSPVPADGNVGVGTSSPHSSALLDLRSIQKGFLLPSMTLQLRNAIPSPAQGLLVYCTNCSPASIYQYRGSAWARISGLSLEDADSDTKILVEKNADEDKIRFDMNGTEYFVMSGPRLQIYNSGQSVFIGESAGMSDDLTTNSNVFIGYQAGQNNISGSGNVGIGADALKLNTYGQGNTALGSEALRNNSYSGGNTASGFQALLANTTGSNNTANGYRALYSNVTGSHNTAFGHQSLYYNSNGSNNLAVGTSAMLSNTSGYANVAMGHTALLNNTSGFRNVAAGAGALGFNTIGESNVAIGFEALTYITTGGYNTGIGRFATSGNGYNPSNLTAIGYNSGHLGNNSNTIEVGNSSVNWIGGQVNWSTYSDWRIKDNITSNVPGLEFITKLNPVTYQLNIRRQNDICGIVDTAVWEGKYDIEKITQSGFLAQEVYEAADEINYDFNGVTPPTGNAKLYSVQYAAFVVPLVKAVQELSVENNELKAENNSIRAELTELRAMVESIITSHNGGN